MHEPLSLAQEYGLAVIQRAEEALRNPDLNPCAAWLWKRELTRGRALYHHFVSTSAQTLNPKESFHAAL